jgi:Arf-GAP/GTPase/ANK repeat/PH domain-containing protein 1/3
MCIECSGVHRQLGSHVSRVRSLGLDEWPPGHLAVMLALGNRAANEVWEGRPPGHCKPKPDSTAADKERFIKAKYLDRAFVANGNEPAAWTARPSLAAAARAGNTAEAAATLAIAGRPSQLEASEALRLAALTGNLALVQLLLWVSGTTKVISHNFYLLTILFDFIK